MRRGRIRLGIGMLAMVVAVPLWTASQPGLAATAPGANGTPAVVQAPDPRLLSPDGRAMLEAERTGQRVELPESRTETGQVFANPDGTKTMEQHAQPVRIRRGTGWVAPDPTLRLQPDGTVRPGATVVPMVLSGGGNSALLAIGTAGAQVRMGWPGKLPVPVLRGDTATYPEVFPGVDLQLKVGIDGFSHLLVVKNRAAARNPALRTLRYPVAADGLTISIEPDGTTVAKDRSGRPVFTAGTPMMWDTGDAGQPAARYAQVGNTLASGNKQLVLSPDLAMLTDPAARFPIYIDPSLSGNLINWLHVNPNMGEDNGWFYDRNDEGAKVGRAYGSPENLYRSMFLLSTVNGAQTIAGSTIIDATFRISLNKTPGSTPTPVQLWHLDNLNTGTWIDWGNQEPYWKSVLDTRDGEAYPWTEDNLMEFNSNELRSAVQAAANSHAANVSLGLRAPDENNQWQWKKFHPQTAVISIDYNTVPRAPKGLNMTRPKPCGTSQAPTPITAKTPQFSAVANDPDTGDTVTTTLEIRDPAGTVVHSSNVGPTVSGAAFSWPQTPEGKLSERVTYRYRAFTKDIVGAVGPATADCYFVIDTLRPAAPQIESTDYPEYEPVLPARTVGKVTFRPGSSADTDVAEYTYGFQQDKITMRVKAGADGVGTVPITVWPDASGRTDLTLFVQAVDRAGNLSRDYTSWALTAEPRVYPKGPVRADSNGDGLADVTAVFDHGYGRTAVWNMTSAGIGFHTGVIGLDTGEGGGFAFYRTKPVQGDLDGDGRADMAMFREGAGRQIWLYKLMSDGNRYNAPPHSWTSGPNGWPLSTARVISGDVDGDGKDDIVVQNAGTAQNWQALVFTAATNFSQPKPWVQAATGNPWSSSAPLLADIDGDKKADLVSVRNLTGCRTAVDLYKSTGTAFTAATTIYDSGASGHCWEKSRYAVADVDNDAKDDLVALHENAPSDASLLVFRSSGTALTRAEWRRTGDLDLSKATLATGDYDGDGLEDAAVVYAGGQTGDRQIFTFRSSGTSFADKVLGWGGPVDAVTGPKFDIEHRQYELVNRNSGKCLNVEFANPEPGERFIQYQCLEQDLNARFRLMPIPGTEQYSVRPVHTATGDSSKKALCADVIDGSTNENQGVIQWMCGGGNGEPNAWQQVTIDYVDGSSYDTVVQLRFAHSGKCLSVAGGGTADRDGIVQQTCGQASNQQWILRPAYNADQLGENGAGRYRTESALGPMVLDVTNCGTANESDVRMWDWVPDSSCQKWALQSLGDDVYKIIDPNSGKALDLSGCSKLPTAPAFIFESNDGECEKWRIEPTPAGTYSVIAVSSGLSLDVAECSANRGADVITWFYWGGPCQRWLFKEQ